MNYIHMLSELPEKGWELGEMHEFLAVFNVETKVPRMSDENCTEDDIPLWNSDDLEKFAGIETVKDWSNVLMDFQGEQSQGGYKYFNLFYDNNYKPVELRLAILVRQKLGKVWNFKTETWEDG